jgi:hypothetical protein
VYYYSDNLIQKRVLPDVVLIERQSKLHLVHVTASGGVSFRHRRLSRQLTVQSFSPHVAQTDAIAFATVETRRDQVSF